jgi:hypothetical protein
MLTRRLVVNVTLAVVLLGLAGSSIVGWRLHSGPGDPPRRFHAAWKHTFESPSDLARGVDAIVVARTVQTRPGRIATSDNGEDVLPFEEVTFEIQRALKGARDGESLTVERVGGLDREGQVVLLDGDGGPFELGETYLLFLMRQEEGPHFYQVNDQGRFGVRSDHLEAANDEGSVTGFFHGRGTEESLRLIAGYLRAGHRTGDTPAKPE